jgi:membrane protease YdiL (CAAX protease family)
LATLLARVREPILPFFWPKGAWNPWLSLLTLFGLIVVNVIPAAGFIVWYNMAHLHISGVPVVTPPTFDLIILQIVTYVPVAIFLLSLLPPISRVSLAELGIRKPTNRDVMIGFGGSLVMLVVVLLASQLMSMVAHHHDTEEAVTMLKQVRTPSGVLLFVILATVLAPLIEELTFRVFIFGALTRWLPVSGAAIGSGLLFGAAHVAAVSQFVTVGVPLMLGGIILAYVYAKSRCYWSSVITHATFNAINVGLLLIFHVQ